MPFETTGLRFTFGEAAVEFVEDDVLVNGTSVNLTKMERKFVDCLASKQGFVRTHRMLLEYLYPSYVVRPGNILKVFACDTAKKLKDAPGLIGTSWGRGYGLALNAATTSDKVVVGINDTLPRPGGRWTPRRKEDVVSLVAKGSVSLAQVLAYYSDLAEDELEEWRRELLAHGARGVSATKAAL